MAERLLSVVLDRNILAAGPLDLNDNIRYRDARPRLARG